MENSSLYLIVILSLSFLLCLCCFCSLIFLILLWFRKRSQRFRHSPRFGYVQEERQSLLNERTQVSNYNREALRSRNENALHCTSEELLLIQTAIRSTRFQMQKPIGRAPGKGEKIFVLCRSRRSSRNASTQSAADRCVMTISHRHTKSYTSQHRAIIQSEDDKIAFIRLLKNLNSKYLMPTRDVDFTVSSQRCIVFRDYVKNGSLKDAIHGVNAPLELDYTQKYYAKDGNVIYANRNKKSAAAIPLKEGTRPLKRQQCVQYGRQILLGLQSLQKIGLRFPHLSTTNVLVVNRDECLLTEFENIFLDHPRAYAPYITEEQKDTPEELIAFGHMLFEMATGQELGDQKFPQILTQFSVWPDLEEILKMILSPSASSEAATIQDLLEHSFFQTNTNLDYDTAPALSKLTAPLKKLIGKVDAFVKDPLLRSASRSMRSSRDSYSKSMSHSLSRSFGSFKTGSSYLEANSDGILKTNRSPRARKRRAGDTTPSSKQEKKQSETDSSSSAAPPAQQSQPQQQKTAPPPPPPAPPKAPAPPPSTSNNQSSSGGGGRGALFADIRKGISLKKVPDSEKKHNDKPRV